MNTKLALHIVVNIALILVLLFISGCNINEKAVPEKPVIAVSIIPVRTFVKAICDNLVEVVTMVPPGHSPANYEPTPKEMTKLGKAKLYFAIGVPTETANILPKVEKTKGIKIVKLQEEVSKVYPDREVAPGQRDPHIWLSPKRAKVMIELIALEMEQLDPKNTAEYRQNAQKYIVKLDELDKELQKTFENIRNNKFIAFHPAFGYFADDYGLKMYALEEQGKKATLQHLREMVDFARTENIKVVFYQTEISSKQAQTFADEIRGKTVELDPLSPNYIQNLKDMARIMSEVMN